MDARNEPSKQAVYLASEFAMLRKRFWPAAPASGLSALHDCQAFLDLEGGTIGLAQAVMHQRFRIDAEQGAQAPDGMRDIWKTLERAAELHTQGYERSAAAECAVTGEVPDAEPETPPGE